MTAYTRNMNDTATVYSRGAFNDYGEPTMGAGVAIKCRWQETADLLLGADGEQFVSKAVIYVSQKVVVGSFIARGAGALSEAHEVRFSGESPSLKGGTTLYKVAI